MTPFHLCSSTDVYLLAKREHIGSGWLHLITSDFISVSYEFFSSENIKSCVRH